MFLLMWEWDWGDAGDEGGGSGGEICFLYIKLKFFKAFFPLILSLITRVISFPHFNVQCLLFPYYHDHTVILAPLQIILLF